jgi:C-terminal processing protease CtpA/Prc
VCDINYLLSYIVKAMEELMRRFNDPYSRHIPETSMTVRQRGIRGEMIGIGVVLKRTWKYSELGRAVVELFLSSGNNGATVERTVSPAHSHSTGELKSSRNGLTTFFDRFNRRVLGNAGQNSVRNFPSLIQHFCVTFHTAAPFLLSATCHRFVSPRMLATVPFNIRGIRIFGICVGALQILIKMTPVLCPIEVDSLQSGGPSILSGVEIGDQIHFIDGRAVNKLPLATVNELLNCGNVGDIVSLGIVRDSLVTAPSQIEGENNNDSSSNYDNSRSTSRQGVPLNAGEGKKSVLKKKNSSSKRRKSRAYITLGVMKDNVFAGKVSSSILSYTEPRFKRKFKSKLVASAGELMGGEVYGGRGGIGYIAIKEFTQRTVLELENAIDKIRTLLAVAAVERKSESRNSKYRADSSWDAEQVRHLSALVIDLRGNLGGTLPSALDAASLFLPSGKPLLQMKRTATVKNSSVVDLNDDSHSRGTNSGSPNPRKRIATSIIRMLRHANVIKSLSKTLRQSRMNRKETYYSTCKHADITTPLLLLVDSQTASASEIFASALLDNSRAVSVGSITVGKNVAQVRFIFCIFVLRNRSYILPHFFTLLIQAIMMLTDGSGLVFTVREFLGPFGRYGVILTVLTLNTF